MTEYPWAKTRWCLQFNSQKTTLPASILVPFKSPDKKNRYPLKDFPAAQRALAALESPPVFDDGLTSTPLRTLSQFLQK